MRGVGAVKRLWKRVVFAGRSRALILLYHRIADLSADPQLLAVRLDHFKAHLRHLRQSYRLIGLRDLVRELREERVPHRSVVITFDDGYADNAWNATPLLRRYGVPATIFVASGYVGHAREFWWDELERRLLVPARLPDTLELTVAGRRYQWNLDGEGRVSGASDEDCRRWTILSAEPWTARQRCYAEMHRLLLPLDVATRTDCLRQLAAWAASGDEPRADYRPLSVEELATLAGDELVEIGSHTVSHPALAAQSAADQRREIIASKQDLERMTGRPVTAFSYPYGGSPEVAAETLRLVREAGFELACANVPHAVMAAADLYFLPRFMVRDWPEAEFAKRLARMFYE